MKFSRITTMLIMKNGGRWGAYLEVLRVKKMSGHSKLDEAEKTAYEEMNLALRIKGELK